jgi:amidase
MTDACWRSAGEVAAAIRRGECTAVEVVETLLARIERYNPALNAIVTVDADGARRRAREADESLARGEAWGPLHGVPITIKDSFETAGMRTVSGNPRFAGHVPREDAPPVGRLRRAGAIVVGKTNLPRLASGIQTDNPVFGRTNNPWDPSRTPGGSSGGAVAAVAAAVSYLDLGSDIGGSIRIPAHFCGVFGLKATGGRVSGKGHLSSPRRVRPPAGWEPLLELASFGPLARTVEDLRLVLPLIEEPSPPPARWPAPSFAEPRIAWTDDFGGAPLSAECRAPMQQLGADLERAGCRVARTGPAGLDYGEAWYVSGVCLATIDTLFQPRLTQWVRRVVSSFQSSAPASEPLMRGLVAGQSMSAGLVRDVLLRRESLMAVLEGFLEQWDVWVCPVFPTPAFTHRPMDAPIEVDGQAVSQLSANLLHCVLFNVTGHPVVTIPIGQSSRGLPVGVQIVGRRWREVELMEAARRIAGLTRDYRRPPGY